MPPLVLRVLFGSYVCGGGTGVSAHALCHASRSPAGGLGGRGWGFVSCTDILRAASCNLSAEQTSSPPPLPRGAALQLRPLCAGEAATEGVVGWRRYRGHEVAQTLIRAYFSPAATTGQRYIYSGSADGAVCVWGVLPPPTPRSWAPWLIC